MQVRFSKDALFGARRNRWGGSLAASLRACHLSPVNQELLTRPECQDAAFSVLDAAQSPHRSQRSELPGRDRQILQTFEPRRIRTAFPGRPFKVGPMAVR